jgi:hypothetical protein
MAYVVSYESSVIFVSRGHRKNQVCHWQQSGPATNQDVLISPVTVTVTITSSTVMNVIAGVDQQHQEATIQTTASSELKSSRSRDTCASDA